MCSFSFSTCAMSCALRCDDVFGDGCLLPMLAQSAPDNSMDRALARTCAQLTQCRLMLCLLHGEANLLYFKRVSTSDRTMFVVLEFGALMNMSWSPIICWQIDSQFDQDLVVSRHIAHITQHVSYHTMFMFVLFDVWWWWWFMFKVFFNHSMPIDCWEPYLLITSNLIRRKKRKKKRDNRTVGFIFDL